MRVLDMFDHWTEVRRDLLRALDMLSDEQLCFVPREGLRSLGQVARHIARSEDGWFRYVVKGELSGWPPYTAEEYPTVESVKRLLTQVHERTTAYLAMLDEADLQREIITQRGEKRSLGWIIWHVLEHEIHHRGEIFLMLGLMGMEGPDI